MYESMMIDASHGISWSSAALGAASIKIERAYAKECASLERIVRDAIVDYRDMIRNAPNDEAASEIMGRMDTANKWLVSHGFAAEADS